METKYPKKYYLSKRYTLKDILKSFSGNLKTVGTGYLIFPLVSSSLIAVTKLYVRGNILSTPCS